MYKVTFKAKSGFKSGLTSSTLFGAVCNTIANVYGEVRLKEVVENGCMVFSNTFVEGTELVDTNKSLYGFNTYERTRKGTSGKMGSIEKWEDGNLYFLVDTTISKAELTSILEVLFQIGIGAGKSIGLGTFELISIKEFELDNANDANGYIVLSDYIPNTGDSTLGDFTARILQGKDKDGTEKEPVYVINAGSKFIGNPTGNTIGQIVFDKNTNTYISGQAIVKRIRV